MCVGARFSLLFLITQCRGCAPRPRPSEGCAPGPWPSRGCAQRTPAIRGLRPRTQAICGLPSRPQAAPPEPPGAAPPDSGHSGATPSRTPATQERLPQVRPSADCAPAWTPSIWGLRPPPQTPAILRAAPPPGPRPPRAHPSNPAIGGLRPPDPSHPRADPPDPSIRACSPPWPTRARLAMLEHRNPKNRNPAKRSVHTKNTRKSYAPIAATASVHMKSQAIHIHRSKTLKMQPNQIGAYENP